jgi:hypothetical protein
MGLPFCRPFVLVALGSICTTMLRVFHLRLFYHASFSALEYVAFRNLTFIFQACFLYLFHNGQINYAADEPRVDPHSFCQAQPWQRSIVRTIHNAGTRICSTRSSPVLVLNFCDFLKHAGSQVLSMQMDSARISLVDSLALMECTFSPKSPLYVSFVLTSTSSSSFPSYNFFISSKFLSLEEASRFAESMPAFNVPTSSGLPRSCPVSLLLSLSDIGGQPCRQLLLLSNGNLMASSFQLIAQRFRRKYFRLSFPVDPASPEYRGPAVASSANSDLFRMLSHFSEQLLHMRCSPLPHSVDALESSVSLFEIHY